MLIANAVDVIINIIMVLLFIKLRQARSFLPELWKMVFI